MDYESDSLFPRNKTGRDSEVRNSNGNSVVVERIVDKTGVFVRVQSLDKNGLISRPLPVKQHGSRGAQHFYCPKIGDSVSVTWQNNSLGGEGYVDGSFYNTSNPPPILDPDTRHITFQDGTVIEYAETGSHLLVDAKGDITVKGATNIIIQGGANVNVKAGGILTLDCPNTKVTGILWVDNIKPYQASETVATPHVKNQDGSGGGS